MTPIRTVEMHAGGEPVRIVVGGYPPIEGETILAKRRFAREHLDHLRRLLIFEPRGHADMYGAILVESDHSEADLAVLFIHNEGYSTMCGHATIALGRWAIDSGLVERKEPETRVAIQVPAGLVRTTVEVAGGHTGRTRFESVPAFLAATTEVDVPGFGRVPVDIAYGGAFYAFAPAAAIGLDLKESPVADLVAGAWAITRAVAGSEAIEHPDGPDLGFLYGTILTDGADDWSPEPTANICVFAHRQVDRSPTGSGVTARIAIQHARGQIAIGQERTFESIVGTQFTGKALRATTVGEHPAVIVEVAGQAHYTGEAVFTVEEDDGLEPFLVR
ncbi:MAG: proline racemase family protein [Acidimicrobiia bacterium]